MQLGPPWTPDRYEEIEHCIVRHSWKNTIIDIQTEPKTSVNTDHFTMIATIRRKLKANEQNNQRSISKTSTLDQTLTTKEI